MRNPFLSDLPTLPSDPILKLPIAFRNDPRPHKINLGVGAYRDADGLPWVLPSVKEAEKRLLSQKLNKEYLPIEGDPLFIEHFETLLFPQLPPKHVSVQTVGGTGALRIGAELLMKALKNPTIFLSNPTWPNHQQIFQTVGFQVEFYPYAANQNLLIEEMLDAIEKMPAGSIILLQPSCHNPTGIDPTKEEWKKICQSIRQRHLLPFFDIAYQGFGKSFIEDIYPISLFISEDLECLISYSFAKNMGLYGERLGTLTVCAQGEGLLSQIRRIIRTLYSSPPLHGALIAKTILSDPLLKAQWEQEVEVMRTRIQEMRQTFAQATHMPFLCNQKGMFSYTGLSKEQVERLVKEYAIHMPDDGRINFAGLIPSQIETVAQAIETIRNSTT